MENNKNLLAETFKNLEPSFFSFANIADLIENQKVMSWSLPNKTSISEILIFLLKHGIVRELDIKLPYRTTTRYLCGLPPIYQIALSLTKNAYLTHFSALFFHGLTNNVTKRIYTNVEQGSKYFEDDEDNIMEQKNIDLAFSRPMRKTNQIAQFDYEGEKYQVYMLNGKKHDRLGVKDFLIDEIKVPITDIERTLIDSVVRPGYSGGVEEVLQAFKEAKGKFSVNKMIVTLKKMGYKYPYHQLLGFYLENAGYPNDVLRLIRDQFEIKYNFYLTYQMKDKEFSDTWKVFYPKGFLENTEN